MWRISVGRCAAVALVVGSMSVAAGAQQDDLFGPIGEDVLEPIAEIDPAPAAENPFRFQDEAADVGAEQLCRCVGGGTLAPSVARIRAALDRPLKGPGLDFTDQPLVEVAALLQEEYDIPIKVDGPALAEMGVDPDAAINVNLRGISLRAALRLMLSQLGLTHLIRDEVLLITTPDEAEKHLEICVYDVRDLVDATKPAEVESLVDTIVSCVTTESWAENGGGEAEIRPLRPGLLVVSQIQPVHDEIRELIATIRQMHGRPAQGAAALPAPKPAEAAADSSPIITRAYYLQINQPASGDSLARQVRELITESLPDEQWSGRLESGEPVVLAVLPDRIVLRHRESVQGKVESLLQESGIAYPASKVAKGGVGFEEGGFGGGGGGGFFNPSAERASGH